MKVNNIPWGSNFPFVLVAIFSYLVADLPVFDAFGYWLLKTWSIVVLLMYFGRYAYLFNKGSHEKSKVVHNH